jgi:Tfp pilus assembly protein PilW
MECKITSIKSTRRRQAGAILAEWIIAVAVGALVLAALAAFALYSARFFVTLRNCVDLDSQARMAVDRMSQEIRQASRVISHSPEKLVIEVSSNQVTYAYDANAKTMSRLVNDRKLVLLTGCESARFDIFMRQATNATYDTFPAATVDNAKVVQITWNCSRDILGVKQNTESMQSAQVVIRKQGK